MKKSLIWYIPAISVALGIFLLSTVFAIPIQVEGVSGIDKIEHCFAYFLLTVSFLLAFAKTGQLSKKMTYLILILTASYGFALEWVQFFFFEFRVFEWKDALANLIGVVIGFIAFKLIYRG